MDVLLLSTYELGHQPLGLARPAAELSRAGHEVRCLDLAVERLRDDAVREAGFVGISVPMHTATRLGMRLAERVRRINPRVHVCFYGLYASLNAETLLGRYADTVIGGEYEPTLVDLVNRVAAGEQPHGPQELFLGRQAFILPRRDLLPPLERYARLDDGTRQRLAGYVEASRGCAHQCLHCPITPVYGGRLRIVQQDVVLNDVRQLVDLGARHITFGDPDFFNGVKHSLRIVDALHAEFPDLTYDVTIKVEHLIEHRSLLPRLTETGCAFVVSAVEAVDDAILGHLKKGHTAADVEIALGLARQAGLVPRPTFVAFTPWTSLAGYLGLLDFVERYRLVGHVDPIQYAIRLLVPRGSSLIGTPAMDPYLGPFEEETLTYRWEHPDPRVDALQKAVARVVERAASDGEPASATFQAIKDLAFTALGGVIPDDAAEVLGEPVSVPRLTEAWFC